MGGGRVGGGRCVRGRQGAATMAFQSPRVAGWGARVTGHMNCRAECSQWSDSEHRHTRGNGCHIAGHVLPQTCVSLTPLARSAGGLRTSQHHTLHTLHTPAHPHTPHAHITHNSTHVRHTRMPHTHGTLTQQTYGTRARRTHAVQHAHAHGTHATPETHTHLVSRTSTSLPVHCTACGNARREASDQRNPTPPVALTQLPHGTQHSSVSSLFWLTATAHNVRAVGLRGFFFLGRGPTGGEVRKQGNPPRNAPPARWELQ